MERALYEYSARVSLQKYMLARWKGTSDNISLPRDLILRYFLTSTGNLEVSFLRCSFVDLYDWEGHFLERRSIAQREDVNGWRMECDIGCICDSM